MHRGHAEGGRDDADQWGRDFASEPRKAEQDEERSHADGNVGNGCAAAGLPQGKHFLGERIGQSADFETGRVLELQRKDHRGDPRSETRGDRMRNKLDEAPESEHAHREEHQPREQPRCQQALDSMAIRDGRKHNDARRSRPRHLVA